MCFDDAEIPGDLSFLGEIRDVAVKRVHPSSMTTIRLLGAAVHLVTAFGDSARATTLDRIRTEVKNTIEDMQHKRDALLGPMRDDFRRQREELKRKEREAEAEILKHIGAGEDTGSLLETYVREVLLAEARSRKGGGHGGSCHPQPQMTDEGMGDESFAEEDGSDTGGACKAS